jgi:hypothetical protein
MVDVSQIVELPSIYTARRVREVTPADANLPEGKCRALWIGTSGTLNFMDESNTIIEGFPAKAGIVPIVCVQVRTGGTASNIWALY